MVSASRLRGQSAKAVSLGGFIIVKMGWNSLVKVVEGFEYPVSCVQDDVAAPDINKKYSQLSLPSRGESAYGMT